MINVRPTVVHFGGPFLPGKFFDIKHFVTFFSYVKMLNSVCGYDFNRIENESVYRWFSSENRNITLMLTEPCVKKYIS